jgi:thioredoxin-like negative regulator of GroEL
MHTNILDPWENAAEIAQLLNQPNTALVIGLGAEWCQLCTDFKPYFFHLSETEKNILWLWYNLEEHEELLGNFYPETLPLVWIYQGSKLIRYGRPAELNSSSASVIIDFIQSIPIANETANTSNNIRQYLLEKNWAA